MQPAIAAPPTATPRAMCGRCRRPLKVCYCAAIPRLDTATRVVILQHPRERDVAIGTARMAKLCLPQAELHVGIRWDGHAALARALGDAGRPPILLSPGPDARDLVREPPAGPVTLVVVDGTWSQARTVIRDNPCLQALPRYAFTPPEASRYRIRREPRADYVSTIEALMYALGVLEGDLAPFRALLAPLDAMVDAQLACQATAPRRTSYRRPAPAPTPRRRIPEMFTSRFDDLVCVAGEANAFPYRSRARTPGPDELVHWVAHRVATGDTFDVVARPAGAVAPSTLFHAELAEADLRGGVPRDELLARFARFLLPTDLVCAWGDHAIDLLHANGGALPADRIDLRTTAHRIAQRKLGRLEDLAATLGPPPPPLARGRAGRRLAMLAQVVRAWRDA